MKDMTTLVVQCLTCKTTLETGQFGCKWYVKKWIFCPSLNQNTTFCPIYKLSKIPKQHFVHEKSHMTKIIQYHKSLSCFVLPRVVLFCLMLLFLILTA